MVLRRWEPFRELRQMQENMDWPWRSFGHGEGEEGNVENWAISLDVVQQGGNIIVKASVPGVNPEDLDVSILRWAKTTQDKEDNILMTQNKKGQKQETNVLEEGNIYFMYRPRVNEGDVQSLKDVQRFYLVLSPRGKKRYRLMVMPKKQLPNIKDGGQKFWGFVEKVSSKAADVENELDKEVYETKTRGEQVQPEARPAGEGVYSIVRHGDHTHLVYVLELPDKPKEVQRALNIEEEASYIISVKNPDQPSPEGVGLDEERQADFPKKLQGKFRGRRFADVDPPDFLNYEGAELLFIGAAEDVSEGLGIELEAEEESESTAEIFKDLRLEKSQHPIEPLLKGEWA